MEGEKGLTCALFRGIGEVLCWVFNGNAARKKAPYLHKRLGGL